MQFSRASFVLSVLIPSLSVSAAPLQSTQACAKGLDGKVPSWAPKTFSFSGNVRTYYIAAEQVTWDYAPSGWDNWLGVPINDSPRASAAGILKSSGSLGGTVWEKAMYRGYTDATFQTLSKQEPTQGIQGPTMRAEVGDLVQILFTNKLPKNYASIHSMGLTYNKGDEGSIYPNTETGQAKPAMEQEALAPGDCVVYKWVVTSTSAPEPGKNSIAKSYHSYVELQADTNAGLMGPFIVYAPGMMAKTMAANREFPMLYMIFDEALSFMADTNSEKYGKGPGKPMTLEMPHHGNKTIWGPQLRNMPSVFLTQTEAPQFYSLNGYVFENGAPFEMCQYDSVIWYIYAYGADSHSFHMHGNNFLYEKTYEASKDIQDGEQFMISMTAEEPGVWEVICHVNDHHSGGMLHTYQVFPDSKCPLKKLS